MGARPEHDLLQAYLDGSLEAAELAGLESRLIQDLELAEALVVLAREEAIFREWSETAQASACIAPECDQTLAPAIPAGTEKRRPRHSRLAAIAAIAAVVLAVVVFVSIPKESPTGPIVATLEDVRGEVKVVACDGNVELGSSGKSIFAGQEVQTGENESSTVVRVRDCRLVLAPETRVRVGEEMISDSPLVYVSDGIVEAECSAASERRPIVIRSPLAELRGLTGKFNFASLPDATFVESDSGVARLKRKSDGHTIEVPRGRSVMVNLSNEPLQSRTLAARATAPKRTIQTGLPVRSLFFEPEGSSLLTCGGDAIKRWEIPSGKAVSTLFSQKAKVIRQFSASLDGQCFAVGNEDRSAKVIDAISGAERLTYRNPNRLVALALSFDGRMLALSWSAGKEGHEVRLYDTAISLEQTLHGGHIGPVTNLAFSPRGRYLATSGTDRSVRIWNAVDLQPVRNFLKLPNEIRCLAFSPDEQLLAVGDRKGEIRILELSSGTPSRILVGHYREVNALAFAPDGSLLASASGDGTARLWHVARGHELKTFKGHSGTVSSIGFSQDGHTLATGGADRKVLFWDLTPIHFD